MTKEQRKIKELTAQVEELTKQLEDMKHNREYYCKEYDKLQKESEDMHYTLDALAVPRKAPGQQYSALSLSARLTLYIAGVRDNTRDKEN